MNAVPVYDAHPWTDESAPVEPSPDRAFWVARCAFEYQHDDWRAEAMAVPEDTPHPLGRFPDLHAQIAQADERRSLEASLTIAGYCTIAVSLAVIGAVMWLLLMGGR